MDLQALSREQDTRSVPPPRRRWATRLLIPLVVLLATLALIAYAARDALFPATPVDVVRATAIAVSDSDGGEESGSVSAAAHGGSVVAQAPGWVEPDPYPIYVSALAEGVVDRVEVLEGESVEAGQALAYLVDEDARLALHRAEAELSRLTAAQAAALTNLEEPIELIRVHAVAQAGLAEAQASLVRLDAEVAQQQALLAELRAAFERLDALSGASVSAQQLDAARYRVQSQQAVVEATRQRRPVLEAGVEAARAELAAAERDLELRTDLIRARDQANAAVAQAQAEVDAAQLRLDRMTIFAPVDGVVMTRHVSPGSTLMFSGGDPHSADVIHLYDPASLQVRVDVPIADAAQVGVDQRALVIVDVLPDVEFEGVVTRVVHQADISRNTVQFKVRLIDPSPLLKPEMLARVRFFASGNSTTGGTSISHSAQASAGPVAVPRSAVVDVGGDAHVWVVSPEDSRIERRAVTVGGELTEGHVRINVGLNPGDAVVNEPADTLVEGQRVRIHEGGH